jgi:hypothetical protein
VFCNREEQFCFKKISTSLTSLHKNHYLIRFKKSKNFQAKLMNFIFLELIFLRTKSKN